MALPSMPAWHIPTAAEVAAIIAAIDPPRVCAYKTSDETVNNSSTFQNDNQLTAAVAANTRYMVRLLLHYSSHYNAGWKGVLTIPAGATIYIPTYHWKTDLGLGGTNCAVTFVNGDGIGAHVALEMTCGLEVGATAGSVTLQWAQYAAYAADAVVYRGSHLTVTQTSW